MRQRICRRRITRRKRRNTRNGMIIVGILIGAYIKFGIDVAVGMESNTLRRAVVQLYGVEAVDQS